MTNTQQPFDYTGRDYLALRDQLKNYLKGRIPNWTPDANDFGYVLVEAMAYMGDMLSYYVDLAAQESNILSANSPSNIFAHASLYGYQPALAHSAEASVKLTLPSGDNPTDIEVRAGDKVYDPATGIVFEISEDAVVAPGSTTVHKVWEGNSRTQTIGVSTGAPNQRFPVPLDQGMFLDGRSGVTYATITTPYSSNTWAITDTLLDHGPGDYVFAVLIDGFGNATVLFGDDSSGSVPPKDATIELHYRQCSGALGNTVNSYAVSQWLLSYDDSRTSALSQVSITNPDNPVGGVDIESIDSVRAQVVKFAKAQRRAVSTDDFSRVARSSNLILTADSDSRVWTRPWVWVLPRDEQMLTADLETQEELLDTVRENITDLAMAGMSPTVRFGTVADVHATIEVRVWQAVDLRRVAEQVRDAVLTQFSYENCEFDREVTEDYLLRVIRDHLDPSVVRFARVTALYGEEGEVESVGVYLPEDTQYEVTRALGLKPLPGNAIKMSDETLKVVVIGTGTIYVDERVSA